MEAKQIVQSDFLDLLFDGRNKKYGAYALRRNYSKRMLTAIIATILFTLLAVFSLQPSAASEETKMVAVREVVLAKVEEIKPATPPPVPPVKQEAPASKKQLKKPAMVKPKVTEPKLKRTKFTPPVIKKDKDVKQSEMPPVRAVATVDVVTTDGVAREELAANMPAVKEIKGVDGGTGIIQKPVSKKVDENKIFEKVEIEATVNVSKWRRHLERNLIRYIEDAAYEGMAPGKYTVNVRFLVEKDGRISRVTALNNPGYGLARGAEQVVKTGPKWRPGEQNGRKVRSYHTQPITFMIMDI